MKYHTQGCFLVGYCGKQIKQINILKRTNFYSMKIIQNHFLCSYFAPTIKHLWVSLNIVWNHGTPPCFWKGSCCNVILSSHWDSIHSIWSTRTEVLLFKQERSNLCSCLHLSQFKYCWLTEIKCSVMLGLPKSFIL